jgi:hypothetical protein
MAITYASVQKRLKLSSKHFAALLGTSPSSVSKLKGLHKPSVKTRQFLFLLSENELWVGSRLLDFWKREKPQSSEHVALLIEIARTHKSPGNDFDTWHREMKKAHPELFRSKRMK